MYRALYRNLFTRLDAERVHDLAVRLLHIAGRNPMLRRLIRSQYLPRGGEVEGLGVQALGLHFTHPVGLAGGFDKDALCLPALAALGFSFAEVGTVTPQPQPGNDRPRLFRLPEDVAFINRMGFPSAGMEALARNLGNSWARRPAFPVGISLGKNKQTPLVEAAGDYCAALERLYTSGDFFVINVSSPNTPELRRLQTRAYLDDLLAALRGTLQTLASRLPPKPLLVKVSPDLTWEEIDTVIDLALTHGLSGIIATNTTTERPASLRSAARGESGGLSGWPLRPRSDAIIAHIYRQTREKRDKFWIIGVGGVFTGNDVFVKLSMGASLVQSYTGFIYQGPDFARGVLAGLKRRMLAERIYTLEELVGSAAGEQPHRNT